MIQNKHVIRLSFIGLFMTIMAYIILYRYFMIENIVLAQVSDSNNHIAEIYYNEVWQKSKDVTDKLKTQRYTDLLSDQDFIKFAGESLKFFQNINITAISLYDGYGDAFLAANDLEIDSTARVFKNVYDEISYNVDGFFLKDVISYTGLEDALAGSSNYSIFVNATLKSNTEAISQRALVVSYVPIIVDFKVVAVMELITDVTDQLYKIGILEHKVIVTFLAVFAIFFAIVMYNTQYAQKVINQQVQINQLLGEEKNRAEGNAKAQTEFLANVSHELRTPLNAIIGFSEMLMSETYGPIANKQYKEYICDINNSGVHLLTIINDILDLSKASADKLHVDNIEVDLNKTASASMRFVKPRAIF